LDTQFIRLLWVRHGTGALGAATVSHATPNAMSDGGITQS
jgi:hypothetical protein